MRFDASYSDITRDLRDDGTPDDIDNTMINAPGFLSLVKAPFLSPYAHDYTGRLSSYLASEVLPNHPKSFAQFFQFHHSVCLE